MPAIRKPFVPGLLGNHKDESQGHDAQKKDRSYRYCGEGGFQSLHCGNRSTRYVLMNKGYQ